jgi:hypothetical protein
MALRYLFDEHLRGPIWRAVQRHNASGKLPLDVIRVGDNAAIPLGVLDADLLTWAAANECILVSADRSTLPAHLELHLKAGNRSPGVFLIRPGTRVSELISFLELAAHVSESEEWAERIAYVP